MKREDVLQELAEAQITGYEHAKYGEDIRSLAESMAMSRKEWERMRNKDFIGKETKEELDAMFDFQDDDMQPKEYYVFMGACNTELSIYLKKSACPDECLGVIEGVETSKYIRMKLDDGSIQVGDVVCVNRSPRHGLIEVTSISLACQKGMERLEQY